MHDLHHFAATTTLSSKVPVAMPTHQAVPGSEAGQLLQDLRDEERW